MEIDLFDMLVLFILAIVLAIIIGMSIVYVVDKKLNDLQIKIPACPMPVCPQPVCPQPICPVQSNDYVIAENVNTEYAPVLTDNMNVEPTVIPASPNQMIEGYGNVNSDVYMQTNQTMLPMVITQDSNETDKKTMILRQGYNSAGSDQLNVGDLITYPSADDIMRYSGPGCYQSIDTTNVRRLSIDDINQSQWGTASPRCGLDGSVRAGEINQINTRIISPASNDANSVISQDVRLYVPRVYMGRDPYISGISYANSSIETQADIDQIGSIPLNDYNGEPVPIGSFMSE